VDLAEATPERTDDDSVSRPDADQPEGPVDRGSPEVSRADRHRPTRRVDKPSGDQVLERRGDVRARLVIRRELDDLPAIR
jgi:hypothetical protein